MVRLLRSIAIGGALVALVFAVVGLTGAVASSKHHGHHGNPSITSEPFGSAPGGIAVERYTLDNGKGMVVKILTYGGIVQELWVPDRRGHAAYVVLGSGPWPTTSPRTARSRPAARISARSSAGTGTGSRRGRSPSTG